MNQKESKNWEDKTILITRNPFVINLIYQAAFRFVSVLIGLTIRQIVFIVSLLGGKQPNIFLYLVFWVIINEVSLLISKRFWKARMGKTPESIQQDFERVRKQAPQIAQMVEGTYIFCLAQGITITIYILSILVYNLI